MNYEFFVGWRYTRAKRRNHFVSFISLISMLGIALGVAALIVVLSVMNGFQQELRARILSVVAHVQVLGPDGTLADWPRVVKQALALPDVTGAAPFIDGQGMLSLGSGAKGVVVRGILPDLETHVADVAAQMTAGRLDALVPGGFGIVLGIDLAQALGVTIGDKVTLIIPQGLVTPAGVVPRLKQFKVVGIFEVGMFEYDSTLSFIHLEDAQKLFRMEGLVSGVRLKLDDLFQSRRVARELVQSLGDVVATDWTRSHSNFFRAVQVEKNVMFIILFLIVAVAAFNIVSTLVMAVTDKESDIAILRTLGATPFSVMKIFIVQGALIGVVGTALGLIGGVLLSINIDVVVPFLETALNTPLFPKDIYVISKLPADLQRADVVSITLTSLILSLLATLYPSFRASRVKPVEALRYE